MVINMENKNLISEIDITPSTTIYNIFKNLTYNFESAIAEFIDNSTQSYKNNLDLLENAHDYKPKIHIIYYENVDNLNKKNPILQILDNCFGISNDNLNRVLKLNVKPPDTSRSRNEFGMGLKAASFWFGNDLYINSKFIKEDFTSILKMSLSNLDNQFIKPEYRDDKYICRYNIDFGTMLEIRNLHSDKKITDAKLKQLYRIFASKYRQDILEFDLQIFLLKIDKNKNIFFIEGDAINEISDVSEAKPISFIHPKFKIDPDTKNEIKICINDSFIFDGIVYNVTGEIGILNTGSRNIAGLTLFRYGRSIIGDEDGYKYKPYKIFKDPASFEFQRIYGCLNLDDFPVYQAKNGFKWDNGLEEALIEFIHEKITSGKLNLIRLARTIRNRNSGLDLKNINCEETAKELSETIHHDASFKNFIMEYKDLDQIFKVSILDKYNKETFFNLKILKDADINSWIDISNCTRDNEFDVTLNIETPFFDPFNNDETSVKDQFIRFCIYFAYSEIKHREICGRSSHQRNILNEILNKSDFLDLDVKKMGQK